MSMRRVRQCWVYDGLRERFERKRVHAHSGAWAVEWRATLARVLDALAREHTQPSDPAADKSA